MLYICIPSYNEAPTVGVLLWRIRKVFQTYSREYEIIVYDDGSTDDTRERLTPYAEIAPLTILSGGEHRGYAYALDRLSREVARKTRYPRRDAMIVMQADFTDQPEQIPELVKRFEGGADIVVTERERASEPASVGQLRRLGGWALKVLLKVKGVSDPFSTFRVYRISILRELIKFIGEKPLVTAPGWAANVELLMKTAPLARRVETYSLAPRYDLRTRPSRIHLLGNAADICRFAWQHRGRQIAAAASGAQPVGAPATKSQAEPTGARKAGS